MEIKAAIPVKVLVSPLPQVYGPLGGQREPLISFFSPFPFSSRNPPSYTDPLRKPGAATPSVRHASSVFFFFSFFPL